MRMMRLYSSRSPQTLKSWVLDAFSIMMYSAPTGFEASSFQANTSGTGSEVCAFSNHAGLISLELVVPGRSVQLTVFENCYFRSSRIHGRARVWTGQLSD